MLMRRLVRALQNETLSAFSTDEKGAYGNFTRPEILLNPFWRKYQKGCGLLSVHWGRGFYHVCSSVNSSLVGIGNAWDYT
jgi:hypothetical protein